MLEAPGRPIRRQNRTGRGAGTDRAALIGAARRPRGQAVGGSPEPARPGRWMVPRLAARPRGSGADMADRCHSYFDHEADIGIVGRGPTLEAALEAAAEATFAIMADLAAVQPSAQLSFTFDESSN